MSSSSGEQVSTITLEFLLDRPIEDAAQDVRDKVARVRGFLPEDIEEPVVAKEDADAFPIIFISLSSPNYSLIELSDIGDRIIKPRLQTIPGVSGAPIFGERRFSMRVWLSPRELSARGLTAQDVESAIRTRSVEVPAGRIESERREFSVRYLGEMKTAEEFSDLTVVSRDNQLVKLRDVARVEVGPEDERSVTRYSGKDAVFIGVVRQSKANVLDVAAGVHKELPGIQEALPTGVSLDMAFDGTVFVQRSITEARETLLLTAGLVDPHHLPVPGDAARDDHPGAGDPCLDHRDLRDPRGAELLDQHVHAAWADPRDRHRGGRRDHRAGERVSPPGRAGQGSRDRGDRRHEGDHHRGDRHDDCAGRGVLAAPLPDRRHRSTVQRVRRRRRRLGASSRASSP